jgi:tRNA(fMet)-specific endonuclease VapC
VTGYLLDANVISALMQAPLGTVAQCIARVGEGNVFTSVIVAAELKYGAVKRPSARLAAALAIVLDELETKPLKLNVIAHYARIRTELERTGAPIGANDTLIAAHALALEATLVTDNVREFGRVAGLRLENWLR